MRRNPLEWLSEALLTVAAIPVLAMMVHITLDVTLKYTLSTPIQGTLDITSYYYMVSVVVLPMAFVELTRQSIAVDLFYLMMPFRLRVATAGFVLLLSAAGYGGLAAISLPDALRAYHLKEIVAGTINVYVWPMRFILPIALVVTAAVCLMLFYRLLTNSEARKQLTTEHAIDPDLGVG